MMPREYGSVKATILEQVKFKWKNKRIQFQVSGCRIVWHEDKTGAKMWLLLYKIRSDDIFQLRQDLGLKRDSAFVPHITILENELH